MWRILVPTVAMGTQWLCVSCWHNVAVNNIKIISAAQLMLSWPIYVAGYNKTYIGLHVK